jgi:subtilisin family serine protease
VNFARCDAPDEFRYRRGHLVEFAANGQDVEVPWLGGHRKKVTGSSFAAPHLTGLLARLLSRTPHLSPLAAKALLQSLAVQAG